ncbi:MAG: hypothetical protein DLM68_08460 [Hyphomicrobiales bacterium]|nr:MAG: hypothetical protein DLM68_08460 [Hyphomicrobiales bacterium]
MTSVNRDRWGIEIMQRNKDVILGEVGITNGSDNAPRNVFSLTSFARKIPEPVSPSPTRAIKQFQDNKPRSPPVLQFSLNRISARLYPWTDSAGSVIGMASPFGRLAAPGRLRLYVPNWVRAIMRWSAPHPRNLRASSRSRQ